MSDSSDSEKWTPTSSRAEWLQHEKTQSRRIIALVERYRRERGLTVQALCAALDAQGWPVSISTMNGMLGNKRTTISISEVFAFARALDVAPLNLLFPFDNPRVEALPNGRLEGSAFDMSEWFIGETADSPFKVLRDHGRLQDNIVRHNAELAELARIGRDIKELPLSGLSREITDLAAIRRGLSRSGVSLPELRPALAEFIETGMPFARDNDLPLDMVFPLAGLNTPDEVEVARAVVQRFNASRVDRPAGQESNEPPA